MKDFFQAASNAAADTVAGPVDLLSMLLGKMGVNVGEAVGGSDWMKRNGLKRDVPQSAQSLAGETVGLLSPVVAAAKAPQIARGLLDTAADFQRYNQALGPAGASHVLKPLPPGPHYSTRDLSAYTDKLYRRAAIDEAEMYLPRSNSSGSPMDVWFASEPDFALGQGSGKNVLMEFDAANFPGQLSMRKPMAEAAYQKGNAEFLTRDLLPSAVSGNLRSLNIPADVDKRYLRRIEAQAKALGWKRTTREDGTVVFSPE